MSDPLRKRAKVRTGRFRFRHELPRDVPREINVIGVDDDGSRQLIKTIKVDGGAEEDDRTRHQ